MGTTRIRSSAAHPTHACSLQKRPHLKGILTGFPTIQDSLPRSIVTTKNESTKQKISNHKQVITKSYKWGCEV